MISVDHIRHLSDELLGNMGGKEGRERGKDGGKEGRARQGEGLSIFVILVTLNKGQVAVNKGRNLGAEMSVEGEVEGLWRSGEEEWVWRERERQEEEVCRCVKAM